MLWLKRYYILMDLSKLVLFNLAHYKNLTFEPNLLHYKSPRTQQSPTLNLTKPHPDNRFNTTQNYTTSENFSFMLNNVELKLQILHTKKGFCDIHKSDNFSIMLNFAE